MIGLKRGTVKLLPHDQRWNLLFEKEKKLFEEKLAEKHANDRGTYTKSKERFILETIKKARKVLK